ncbi:MAG: CoA-binding protein, partial [Solirubrobacteraceae bacterium]
MTALTNPGGGPHDALTAVAHGTPPATMDLSRLMHPASIAVVGATDRAGSYAAETLVNLELIGFPGPVYGVNPRRTEVMGRVCVPTVADLPEPVDAVVVAIPAAGVAAAVDQAGA